MKVTEFEHAVRASRDRLYGYALYFLDHREEAEDVVQEVYMRLWQHREEIDAARVDGWLISVTRNACRDQLRRRKVRSAVDSDTDRLADVAGDRRSPEADAAASVFQDRLTSALAELPEPQKSIVILREIQDMSYREICDVLDLPMTTVKVYLHRGRRALRTQLSKVLHREAV